MHKDMIFIELKRSNLRLLRDKDITMVEPQSSPEGKGIFITFEGGDGAGKSTHLYLVGEALRQKGYEVACYREPGRTIIGEQLRSILLDPGNFLMAQECELLLYEASRAQLVFQEIKPALARGAVVLCDRFTDSTFAYQAYGRGIDFDYVNRCNEFVCQGVKPDRTVLMLTGGGAEIGLDRAMEHKHADRMEMAGYDFHERVRAGFQELAEQDPDRIRIVFSCDSKEHTARKVFEALSDLFPWMGDPSICTDDYFEDLVLQRDMAGRV